MTSGRAKLGFDDEGVERTAADQAKGEESQSTGTARSYGSSKDYVDCK